MRVPLTFAALLLALWVGVVHASGPAAGDEARVQSVDGLNLRAAPGEGEIVAVADAGDRVKVLEGPIGGEPWFRVDYYGTVGWASGRYLTPAPPRGGQSSRGGARAVVTDDAALLPIPYRSQYDFSPYWTANCGPASLAMVLDAFGEHMQTHDVRREANQMQGTVGWYDTGVDIRVLAELAAKHGLEVRGLYKDGGGFDRWSFDDVRDALRNGHAVIPQVHLATLPGHEYANRGADHYMVIVGYDGDTFIYNDPAASGNAGNRMRISEGRLGLAWKRSDYPFAAFSLGPGPGMDPLIEPPAPPLAPPTPAPAPAAAPTTAPTPRLLPRWKVAPWEIEESSVPIVLPVRDGWAIEAPREVVAAEQATPERATEPAVAAAPFVTASAPPVPASAPPAHDLPSQTGLILAGALGLALRGARQGGAFASAGLTRSADQAR